MKTEQRNTKKAHSVVLVRFCDKLQSAYCLKNVTTSALQTTQQMDKPCTMMQEGNYAIFTAGLYFRGNS